MSDTMTEVKAIAGSVFGVDPASITPESTTDSVEAWDSLQHINFVLALENGFGVSLGPEEIEALRSIKDAVEIIEVKLATK
jgi:acyl carrier protein